MAGKLKGEIVSVDATGNLISDITEHQLNGVPRDESVTIRCDGHTTIGIFPQDHKEPEMTFLAFLDADRRLALALVGASAASFLGIRTGSSVVVSW